MNIAEGEEEDDARSGVIHSDKRDSGKSADCSTLKHRNEVERRNTAHSLLRPMWERKDPANNCMRDKSQFDDLSKVWKVTQMQATYQAATSRAIQQRGDQVRRPGAVITGGEARAYSARGLPVHKHPFL